MPEVNFPADYPLRELEGRSIPELVEMMRERGAWSAENSNSFCLIGTDDESAIAGAAHALLGKKRLLTLKGWEDLGDSLERIKGADSIVVVLSPSQLGRLGLGFFRKCFSSRHQEGRIPSPWGVLTASSPSRLTKLVARIHLHEKPKKMKGEVFWSLQPEGAVFVDDPDVRVFGGEIPPGGIADHLSKQPIPFVSLIGHGRAYCGMSGNLCSREVEDLRKDGMCVGGLECYQAEWPRIPARNLLLDVVLVNSCSAGSPNRGPEPGRNIAVHLLDGFASCVMAPFKTIQAFPITPFLAWESLRCGKSIGQVCASLNAALDRRAGSPETFVLFGDPDFVLFDSPTKMPILIKEEKLAEEVWNLDIPATPHRIETYECRDAELIKASRNSPLYCLINPQEGKEPLIEVLPGSNGSSIQILAVWARGGPTPPLRLTITNQTPFREEAVAIVTRFLGNEFLSKEHLEGRTSVSTIPIAPEGTPFSIVRETNGDSEMGGFLKDLEPRLAQDLGSNIGPFIFSSLFSAEEKLLNSCRVEGENQIRNLALESRERGLWLFDLFAKSKGIKYLHEKPLPDPCKECGLEINRRTYRVGIFPSRFRWLYECEGCDILADIEEGAKPLILEGPRDLIIDAPTQFQLKGTNHFPTSAIVTATISMDHRRTASGSFRVEPEIQSVTLGPNQDFVLSFTLFPFAGMPIQIYRIKGLVSIDGNLSMASKNVRLKATSKHEY